MGVWTRVQWEERSIIDYVLTDTASANTIKEIKIDEEKQYEWHKLDKNTPINENQKIYLDHNSIDFRNTNWRTKAKENNNKKGYERYRT